MFVYNKDGKQFCVIHPEIEATREAIRTETGWTTIKTCTKCNELTNKLKETKSK